MESDSEFLDFIEEQWDHGNSPNEEDFARLFALARRGAAMQWRSISEAPPEFKRILATDGDVRGEAWRYDTRFYWVDDSAAGGITHWMPLPPPPKQENEQ